MVGDQGSTWHIIRDKSLLNDFIEKQEQTSIGKRDEHVLSYGIGTLRVSVMDIHNIERPFPRPSPEGCLYIDIFCGCWVN